MAVTDLWVAQGSNAIPAAQFRKASPPTTGDKFGTWNVGPEQYMLPGGAVMDFDLSRLTLSDFRMMRNDYQLNASLNVLQFLVAQSDWSIYTAGQESDPKAQKISDVIEAGIRRQWIPLVRALAQSFWSGYAPTVLNFDLSNEDYYEVVKYKDLIPEQSAVNWKEHTGANNTKIKTYDGIVNAGKTISAENTLWYPLMMENGNYYGRKLLQPAFPPFFFSTLIHLYANRYYERHGEPTAVGYYPSDESVIDPTTGNSTSAREVMAAVLSNMRSRGVVTIPSERDPETKDLEWDIKFLESQMRGADFETYLARLDEEKSLALFTPVLLFRTGQQGSYNLGTQHMVVFQWMLNALVGDMKTYLDDYLIRRLHDINFGPNAPKSEIRFRTLGRLSDQGAQSILQALIQNGGAKIARNGLKDLGSFLGIDLEYLSGEVGTPNAAPPLESQMDTLLGKIGANQQQPVGVPGGPSGSQGKSQQNPGGSSEAGGAKQLQHASRRLAEQVRRIYSTKEGYDRQFALSKLKLGFKGAFLNDMIHAGVGESDATNFFHTLEGMIRESVTEADSVDDAVQAIRDTYADYGFSAEV